MSKIEDLEARIEQLEGQLAAKAKAEVPPAPSKPWQHYDPTEAMSPPIRLTGRERYRTDLTPEQMRNEYSKYANPVGRLMPLAEFLNKGPLPEPPKAEAVTAPVGKVPGIDAIDAIAKAFADRERAEELAKLVDVASKLKGL
jgi:hypothetical protein